MNRSSSICSAVSCKFSQKPTHFYITDKIHEHVRSHPLDQSIFLNLSLAIILTISAISFSPLFGGYGYQNAQAQTPGEENSFDDSTLQITDDNVLGAYESESGTVKIVFPEGWAGFEVSEDNGSTVVAAVSPDRIVTLEDLADADPVLNLVMSRKASVDMAPGTMPPLRSEISGEATMGCKLTSSKFILLNGVFSEESLSNCSVVNSPADNGSSNGDNATNAKNLILHSILTQTHDRWVALIFYGTPESLEANETQFNSAFDTFEVVGASDLPIPFGSITFKTFNVNANGSRIPVDVKSTSNITEFALDESNMIVSFKAESVNTQGVAELSIGRVLEGPYVVTVNGEVWSDFDIINEETPRESKIQIRYEQEGGQIIIRGTQVVPEFAFGATLGTTGAFTSIIVLAGGLACLKVMAKLGANLNRRAQEAT